MTWNLFTHNNVRKQCTCGAISQCAYRCPECYADLAGRGTTHAREGSQ